MNAADGKPKNIKSLLKLLCAEDIKKKSLLNFIRFQTMTHKQHKKRNSFSPRKTVGVCFYRRWFVCLSVTMVTKKIVDEFVPNFMGRFLGGKERPSLCFVTIGRGMWK